METVSINDLTLCHKNSPGWVKSTLPDVCKSPVDPVPYTNTAYSRDLENGTTTVLSNGDAMCGILGSRFFPSYDDEPGTGGGVISGVNMHQATWLSWSPDVFFEGKPVTRLTDKMLMNRGNTVSLGGYQTTPLTPLGKALCFVACKCMNSGKQLCVKKAIDATPKNAKNGLFAEITFNPDGSMRLGADGMPATQMGVPGSRLYVIQITNGSLTDVVEMKFPGDRFRGNQLDRYQDLADKNQLPLQIIDVAEQCGCNDPAKLSNGKKPLSHLD